MEEKYVDNWEECEVTWEDCELGWGWDGLGQFGALAGRSQDGQEEDEFDSKGSEMEGGLSGLGPTEGGSARCLRWFQRGWGGDCSRTY